MKPSLDLEIVNSLPSLTKLQAQALAALNHHQHFRTQSNRSIRATLAPNLAELCLVATRRGTRLAYWLQRESPHVAEVFSASDVLELRLQFALLLDAQSAKGLGAGIVPASKSTLLATYLAVTPSPTVSSLAGFAGISLSRARVWLKRLAQASIIRCHSRSNELFFLNTMLVSRLLNISPDYLNNQFDSTVSRPDWLKRSVYRTVS